MGFYITPALLGGEGRVTFTTLIELVVRDLLDWNFGASLGVFLLTIVGALFILFSTPLRAGAPDRRQPRVIDARPSLGRPLLWAYCSLALVFLCAPILIVVVVSLQRERIHPVPAAGACSLRWYENYFGSRQWVEPTLLSLRIAFVTMVLSTLLGSAAAIGLTRGRFRGRRALEFFFVSPMVMPTIVLAIGLYLLLRASGSSASRSPSTSRTPWWRRHS